MDKHKNQVYSELTGKERATRRYHGGGGGGERRRRLGFGVDEKMSCGGEVQEWAKIKPPESGPCPGLDAWVAWLYGLHFALSSLDHTGLA